MKKEKSLIELLTDLDQVNRNLDRIKNDPSYIEEKTREIFKNHKSPDYQKERAAILASF